MSLQVFASQPSFRVVVEYLTLEPILLQNFDVVRGLILHANNGVKHIFIIVSNAWDKLGGEWDDTWELHHNLMLRFFFNHLPINSFCLCLFVFDVCKLLSASTFSSLSPIFVIILVMVNQESEISTLELLLLLLVNYNKDWSHFCWVVITWLICVCDELTLSNLLDFLVDAITQIFLIQGVTLFLGEALKFTFDQILLILFLFQFIVKTFLHIGDSSTQDTEGLISHHEFNIIPLEILNIICDCTCLVASLGSEIHFNVKLIIHIELLS